MIIKRFKTKIHMRIQRFRTDDFLQCIVVPGSRTPYISPFCVSHRSHHSVNKLTVSRHLKETSPIDWRRCKFAFIDKYRLKCCDGSCIDFKSWLFMFRIRWFWQEREGTCAWRRPIWFGLCCGVETLRKFWKHCNDIWLNFVDRG